MDATILLADATNPTPDGRVNALGLGWNVTTTPTGPAALVLLLDIDWHETDEPINVLIELLDADGHPVTPHPAAPEPLRIQAALEVARPPGLPPGTPMRQSMGVNVAPGMQLQPGQAYEWRLAINGEHRMHWSARFLVAPHRH